MMNHHPGHNGSHAKSGECCDGMQMFSIPMPMAMFGMCVAFMFGATIGLMMGKKHSMMGQPMGWGKHKMMWHKGRHHHHGFGMPPCGCQDQGETPEMQKVEADT